MLWIGGLAGYMYGLDNITNWEIRTYASNEFGHANWYSVHRGDPSRVIYTTCAVSHSMGTLGAGLVIYEIGFSGLQVALPIVIALLVSASVPYFINSCAGSTIEVLVVTERRLPTTWKDPAIPAMMVVGGGVALPAFVYWEIRRAKFPIVLFTYALFSSTRVPPFR
ncbi:hypothetical protein FOMPIDRAFT_93601 [Fomitopsis schrenkii]|uniref:Uncharacterized protein n=1 Tax=Fomitopsis schrenkii TaxID=2126942 RepID=S8DMX7_FOMSC|nr:hypothetical protein FOMPIDRAFT_93601 [Fomitopsis schrenkii]